MQPASAKILAFFQASFVLLLLFLGAVGHASIMLAESRSTFTATGNMIAARAEHTAILLLNGKVLIAGGNSLTAFNAPVSSAELYDPSTGIFTATGNMTTPRARHTATLLPDGRVLIAGGSSQRPTSAELYDPSTGTFSATGDMITGGGFTATLLGNGKVLITGAPNAELYDPATGAFAVTGAYAGVSPGGLDTATLLPDGRVLITGCDCRRETAPLTQLYDPSSGTFSVTAGTMNGTVGWWVDVNTATLLMNGKVLIAGSDEYDWPADAEVYDPSTGTVAGIGNTIAPHEFSAAALLPDGTVLVAGSQLGGGNGDASAELYVPATGAFYAAGQMTAGRHEHTATLLADGSVLIAGGYSVWPQPTSSAEIYHPAVLVAAPALFSLSGDGRGQGAILHANTPRVASSSDPAVAGEYLEIYLTGLGDGSSLIPPQVAIGGRMAEILYFGKSGYAGLNQVNVRVPSGVAPGPAVPVRLTYLGRPSNEVTIGVQ